MNQPTPVVYGDTSMPPMVKDVTMRLMSELVGFYQANPDKPLSPERVYAILNSLAIVSASVIGGTNNYDVARWFLHALDLNVRAFLDSGCLPPPGTTKQ